MRFWKIIKNLYEDWKIYKEWKAIKNGKEVIHFRRGAGFYLPVGLIGAKLKGRIEEWKMKSGKTAIVKLIDYKTFEDPDDMVEESYWQFLGYKGEKQVREMSFKEYRKLFK